MSPTIFLTSIQKILLGNPSECMKNVCKQDYIIFDRTFFLHRILKLKMQAQIVSAPGELTLKEVPLPVLEHGEILVKVRIKTKPLFFVIHY